MAFAIEVGDFFRDTRLKAVVRLDWSSCLCSNCTTVVRKNLFNLWVLELIRGGI